MTPIEILRVLAWPVALVIAAMVLAAAELVASAFLTLPAERVGELAGALLAILDKISGETAIAALWAIAGYILGGAALGKVL